MFILLNYHPLTGDSHLIGVYSSLFEARQIKPYKDYYSVIYKQISTELRIVEAPFT